MRFLFFILFISFSVKSQSVSVKQFEERLSYEKGNYAIQNYDQNFLNRPGFIWGILKSNEDDLIYMVGNSGILEYDGVKIRRLTNKEDSTHEVGSMGLARTIIQMKNETIYVSGDNRFGKLVTNQYGFKEFESLIQLLPDSIDYKRQIIWGTAILDNKIYMYTPNFIFRWDGESFDKIWKFSDYVGGRSSKGKVHGFGVVGNTIYIRRWGHGLYKKVNDEFEFIEESEFFAQNRIELFYELKNKDVLLLGRSLGAYILKPDGTFIKSKNQDLNNWLINNWVYVSDHLKPFNDGTIPIHSSNGGLLIIDENLNIKNLINYEDGLQTSAINVAYIDPSQNVLIGSPLGFSKVNLNNSLTYYDNNYGIEGYVWSLIKRIDGKLYFGSTEDLYSLKSINNPLLNNKVNQLEINDQVGNYHKFDNSIIVNHNYGTSEYNNGSIKNISRDYGLWMTDQSQLNKKILLASHRIDGMTPMKRDSDGNFKIINKFQPKEGYGVLNYEEISPGKIFLNTTLNQGSYFAEYDRDGNFKFIKAEHPLKDSIKNTLIDSLKNDLSLLPDSSFSWSNTKIGYVAFSDSASIHKIDIKNNKLIYTGINMSEIVNAGLFSTGYNKDAETNWYFTRKGIYEIKFTDTTYNILKIHNWGEIDYNELTGQSLIEGIGENQTIWLGSRDARLLRWLPYKSEDLNSENNKKPLLRGFYVNNEINPIEEIDLDYDSSRIIKFEYAYPVYNKEENNEYRVFLKGQDLDTSDWSKNSFREYTNLSEKNYEFLIQARDTNGNESEFISFSFTILPPWYRTWLAYAGYFSFLIFGFNAFGKYQAKKSLEQADNERRAGELEEAKKIQQSMLPKVYPTSKLFDISAGLVTSTEIGGDYYDFFENKESIYAVCGDATGHGTASGMMVSIIKSGLNGLPALSTNKVLEALNNIVKKIDLGTLKMSLNICEIEKDSITLSSAAMPPIYHFSSKSKKTEEILIIGLPLGGLKNEKFDVQKRKFESNDVLVLLSDGLPEAENAEGELYDYERVQNLITDNATKSAEEIKDIMIGEVDTWLEGKIPDDDVTIVVIKKN